MKKKDLLKKEFLKFEKALTREEVNKNRDLNKKLESFRGLLKSFLGFKEKKSAHC